MSLAEPDPRLPVRPDAEMSKAEADLPLASSALSPAVPPLPAAPPVGSETVQVSQEPLGAARRPAANPNSREARTANSPPASIAALAERHAPPWLFSMVLHMLLVITLGLWMVAKKDSREINLVVLTSEDAGEQLDEPPAFESEQPIAEEQLLTPPDLREVSDPFATPPEVDVSLDGLAISTELRTPNVGLALRGRDEGMKQALLEAYGGNSESESAVMRGLKWLVRQQRPNGSWSLAGPYPDGAGFENSVAATAMAMIAVQGAGHTHRQGKFQPQMESGLSVLLTSQDDEGNFFHESRANDALYSQGLATIAVCELYAMTRDPSLLEPATRAVRYCIDVQDHEGGWRYIPRAGSDTSVTGWIVMALQSARMAGLHAPNDSLYKVDRFLDSVASHDGSRYSYRPNMPPTEAMTAEALLCRQYLGWHRDDRRLKRGVAFLTESDNLPSWQNRNIYYWYYATQVLHHVEGTAWQRWNGILRDMLVRHQVTNGTQDGSWHPMAPEPDRWGFHGGRLFVTCLTLCTLEVYYRHLPLYSSDALARPQE